MNSADAPKTTSMIDMNNYYYKVVPLGLKNAGTTYQRLMDMVFSSQIGRYLEVYVEHMLFKTQEEVKHVDNLRETFEINKEI